MTKTITPITPTKVVPIKPKADTRKASEKKYGKPVMDLGFCIVRASRGWYARQR